MGYDHGKVSLFRYQKYVPVIRLCHCIIFCAFLIVIRLHIKLISLQTPFTHFYRSMDNIILCYWDGIRQ